MVESRYTQVRKDQLRQLGTPVHVTGMGGTFDDAQRRIANGISYETRVLPIDGIPASSDDHDRYGYAGEVLPCDVRFREHHPHLGIVPVSGECPAEEHPETLQCGGVGVGSAHVEP